jgi:O-antigen ligase
LRLPYDPAGGPARAAFFALLPAAAAGGALALPVLMCLAGAASLRPSLLQQAVEKRPLALALLLIFTAWAAASSAWSPYPIHVQAIKLALIVPLGLMFAAAAGADARAARLTLAAGLAAFIVLAALLAVEAAWGLPLNRAAQPGAPMGELGRNTSRGAIVLLALTWPVAAHLLGGGKAGAGAAILALIASAALSLPFGQLAHPIALAAGLAAFALAFAAPRFALLTTTGVLAGWTLAAPFLTPLVLSSQRVVDMLPLSWAVRVGVWEHVCARILQSPWIGHGLDASRADAARIVVRDLEVDAIPLHPHSASLQIWFETGAVGATLAAAALALGGWSLARALAADRFAAAAAAATIASLGVIANVSFGLWQEWWNATLFIAAALTAAVGARRAGR